MESGAARGWQHPHLLNLRRRLLTFLMRPSPNTHAQRTARKLQGSRAETEPWTCVLHVSCLHLVSAGLHLQNTSSEVKLLWIFRQRQQNLKPSMDPYECGGPVDYVSPTLRRLALFGSTPSLPVGETEAPRGTGTQRRLETAKPGPPLHRGFSRLD